MYHRRLAAAFAVVLSCAASPCSAQSAPLSAAVDSLVRSRYGPIAATVVLLRTESSIEFNTSHPVSGLMMTTHTPLPSSGTGLVIGTVEEDGRREYLILTNDHVVNGSLYFVREGRGLRARNSRPETPAPGAERAHLVLYDESASEIEVPLVPVARYPQQDLALMKTVEAPVDRLSVLPLALVGLGGGSAEAGATVITSGYPLGEPHLTSLGRVAERARAHDLGEHHLDDAIDLVIRPGQSGSPVFEVEVDSLAAASPVRFTLIGVLHARDRGQALLIPFPYWAPELQEIVRTGTLPPSPDARPLPPAP